MKKIVSIFLWIIVIAAAVIMSSLLIAKTNEALRVFNGNYTKNETTGENDETQTTNAPKITEAATAAPEPEIELNLYGGDLELPVIGATGYASVDMDLIIVNEQNVNEVVTRLRAGTAFVILWEENDWWYVAVGGTGGTVGWVMHAHSMINLPDVVPSIIYNNYNAYKAEFMSGGEPIPGLHGEKLYSYSVRSDGKVYNERLQKYEYIVPVLYSTAKRVCKAQKNALDNGDTLVIYEAFRPYPAQTKMYNAFVDFINKNPHIGENINSGQWNTSWFIASGVSSHQRGYTVDAGLAKAVTKDYEETGGYHYLQITQSGNYEMPTFFGELSIKSAVYQYPVQINSFDAWKSAEYSEPMQKNAHARSLQKYFTDADFTPLASEWWHFNDLHTMNGVTKQCDGNFEITDCFSTAPK